MQERKYKYRHLFFLPSFYLLITFTGCYLLYLSGVINWEKAPAELHFWCSITILSALLSTLVYSRQYNRIINDPVFLNGLQQPFLTGHFQWLILLGISGLGMLGIVKYVIDYANFLGAVGIFFSIFTNDTGQLRTLADNVESAGTQVSYFTWMSAFIITAAVANGNLRHSWLWSVVIFVLLNSIFLDRTRPVWIIFTCALCYFIIRYHLYTRKKIISVVAGITAFFLTIFIAIGSLLGKGSDDENYLTVDLPQWLQPIFLYLTSSFAYLGRLLYNDAPVDYHPARITYPVQKVLAKFHLAEQPPNQILEFFSVPLLTNVGTFLEPFFQDGGRPFILMAILLHTFVFDQIVLFLMKRVSVMAVIAIATICFINFIGFFVPKVSSTATWFILLCCWLFTFSSRFGNSQKTSGSHLQA